ncbi:hypothetical protein IDH33_01620 [Pelagibacterales bacterium SAG-MED43]|nr:hypothetical protein [Pelagibacterales bacterium SAG-MED43]
MIELIIFFSFFFLLLLSTIGFGILFQNLCFGSIKNLEEQNSIYIGFYGLFFLICISLVTSLLFPHNFTHNILIHFFGILSFILFKIKNKKKYLKIIFVISIFTISALIISKTHDDFSYYHLPITKYLTEHKIIFGTANLTHGYKLLSSLFFLNSIFYLPFIEYYSFHFSLLFFLIFFNYFLIKEIFFKKNDDIIKYIYLLAFAFFNLSFNRLAEYGTDKVGQLLIVILLIKVFQLTCFDKDKNSLKNLMPLIPLMALCITLKTYFLPYAIIVLTAFVLGEKFFKTIKFIFFSKSFLFFFLATSTYFLHHFISTGCIISPLSTTCYGDYLEWANNKSHYERLSNWLEQWAKAGAGPNFRVENPNEYIKNFNWLPRWFEYYFMGKVKDQLLIFILTFLVILFLFKNLKFENKNTVLNKKFLFFYSIILIIFLIWFTNHPQLRYGGYSILFLTLSIPLAIFLSKFKDKKFFKKKFNLLILLVVLIFNVKNFTRINDEFQRTDHYKFEQFPFFAIQVKDYSFEKTEAGLVIYQTNGHCWNIPSPCVQSMGKLGVTTVKKNGYYFIKRK